MAIEIVDLPIKNSFPMVFHRVTVWGAPPNVTFATVTAVYHCPIFNQGGAPDKAVGFIDWVYGRYIIYRY